MAVLTGQTQSSLPQAELLAVARGALDEHWAVAAIPAERRALLLGRADDASTLHGEGLGEPIADGLALLGTAYELAALAQLDAALDHSASASRDLARTTLSLGAARAFRLGAALRPPLDQGDAAVAWALRLGALATVAGLTDVYSEWWHARDGIASAVERYGESLDKQPWESYARGTLWMAWLGLLGAPLRDHSGGTTDAVDLQFSPALVATRTRLAAFRERRAAQPNGADSAPVLNSAALRTRMAVFAIRHLADATELLTIAVLRRTLPDVSGEFRLRLSAARSAMAGDHTHDVLLAWLQAAGVTMAGGVTPQLELPGF